MRQKVGIFQDSSAPCMHTHLGATHNRLLRFIYTLPFSHSFVFIPPFSASRSLLRCFHPALLFPTSPPSGFLSQLPFLPLSLLFGTQLVPLSEPPIAQTGTRGKETAAPRYQARNSVQKTTPTEYPETRPRFHPRLGCAGVPARTNVCVCSYVEEAAHELPAYVSLDRRT